MYTQIRYEVADPVATITLDRPQALNAWTQRMGAEVRHAVDRAEADPAVVGIVLTGAGRAFCAGADMKALSNLTQGGALDTDIPDELAVVPDPDRPDDLAGGVHLPPGLPEADHRRHQRRHRRDGRADRLLLRPPVHGQ